MKWAKTVLTFSSRLCAQKRKNTCHRYRPHTFRYTYITSHGILFGVTWSYKWNNIVPAHDTLTKTDQTLSIWNIFGVCHTVYVGPRTFLILHQVLAPFHFSVCICNWRWRMDTDRKQWTLFSSLLYLIFSFLPFSLSHTHTHNDTHIHTRVRSRHLLVLRGIRWWSHEQLRHGKAWVYALKRYISSNSGRRESRLLTNGYEWFLKEFTFHVQIVHNFILLYFNILGLMSSH